MRKVASYALKAVVDADNARSTFDEAVRLFESWLESKGEYELASRDSTFLFRDGREGELRREVLETAEATRMALTLKEPAGDGVFETSIELGTAPGIIALFCTLKAGGTEEAVAPAFFDVHCPRFLRDLLSMKIRWTYEDTPLSTTPRRFEGTEGGSTFADWIWSDNRSLPVVAISEHEGAILHEGLDQDLARDLAGLAMVCVLDPPASWTMTRKRGSDWSCYHGAVRLYWPRVDTPGDPFRHPLWTQRRLLTGVKKSDEAGARLRRQLRRRILGVSTFTIREPAILIDLRERAREAVLEASRAADPADQDWEELAQLYATEVDALRLRLHEREEEIDDLRVQLGNLQATLTAWDSEAPDEVAPEEISPPATVEEAVDRAWADFAEELVFGDDVGEGIKTVRSEAGPPEKVLYYLQELGEMARRRREGLLGQSAIGWLRERNVNASGESQTILNDPDQMRRRTWHDGEHRRPFELHLKPTDATAPDRCIRIYWDYSEELGRVIIGWIGTHP